MSDLARWTQLLERFRAGTCSPEELQELRELAAVDPRRPQVLGAIPPWRAGPPGRARTSETVEQDLAAVWEAGRRPERATSSNDDAQSDAPRSSLARRRFRVDASPRSTRRIRPSVWTAASLLLVGASAGLVYHRWPFARAPLAQAAEVHTTHRAERASLRLPDGTTVVLGPSSSLSYVDSGTSRLVELRGAAYFDVIHRAETFRVLAAGVVTEDLGTQFVIEAYPGTSTAHVAVESGRVAVRSTASQTPSRMVLGAGTGASVDSLGHLSPIDATEVADLLDWTHGELRLDNAPLRDVAAAVSRWYDIDVQVAGAALERQRLTMTIGIDPVAKTLATIADVTHARIEWHGRSVVLKPN